jgi:hypothetical protein
MIFVLTTSVGMYEHAQIRPRNTGSACGVDGAENLVTLHDPRHGRSEQIHGDEEGELGGNEGTPRLEVRLEPKVMPKITT